MRCREQPADNASHCPQIPAYRRSAPSSKTLAFVVLYSLLVCLISANAWSATTLTVWHPWTKGAGTVRELAVEYTRRTGVRVQVRSVPASGYDPWGGGSQPDIIGLSYPNRGTIVRSARLNRLYNLEPAIQQGWYVDLWSGPLETFVLRGNDAPGGRDGIYGVPLTVHVRAFIYNTKLFRQAGVAPPDTWSDFLTACSRLRGQKAVPFAGGMDGATPSFPVVYEWSYLGSHYLLETYFGRYPYTGVRWRNQFRIYDEMRRYGVTTGDAAQMDRTAAAKYFLAGKTAVILDGPWFDTVRRASAPGFTDWGVFGPPVDRRSPFLPRLPGGVAEGAVVNARSSNRNASIRFLRWLTEPAQQVRLANAMDSLPASQDASHSSALGSRLRAFVPYLNYAAIELRYEESPQVLATLYQGARSVIRGRSTPMEALSATQRVAK